MSKQSIKTFQNAYPRWKPAPAVELRNEASKMRAMGQSMLAKANRLEEIASELDGQQSRFPVSVLAEQDRHRELLVARCSCGMPLRIEREDAEGHDSQFVCWCERCKERSARGEGAIIHVYGYGRDSASALKDWEAAQDRM